MRFTQNKLTPVQAAKVAEILPQHILGSTLGFESQEDIKQGYEIVRAAHLGTSGGELRCLRGILSKIRNMMDDPYRYETKEKIGAVPKSKPRLGDRIVKCTIQQTEVLRDLHDLKGVRWASKTATRTEMLIAEADMPLVVQQLQDLYHEEIVPQQRRIISTVAKKLKLDGKTVTLTTDDNSASNDRLKCLAYVCSRANVPYVDTALTITDMVSMRHADAVISELKQLASMVAGANRICWSLISKLERLRGADQEVVSAAVLNYKLETELMSDEFMQDEPTAQQLMEIELEAVEAETPEKIELSDDGEGEGMNCFFAEESWGELEEYDESAYEDDEDDVDVDWFVYGSIANCLSLMDIPDEDERVHSLDGDDISFADQECRDAWCQEMKRMIEDLVDFDELDQADADRCFNEVLAIENMTSLV